MAALVVVEFFEAIKFALQVASIPKRYAVEILSPDCADEPFHKRVRERYMGHGLYFGCLKYSKISFPLMEPEQGIIIAADIPRRSGSTDRMVEHSAQRWSIDGPGLYTEANDSATTDRAPPGPIKRMIVTIRWMNKMARSRIAPPS